MIEIEKSLRLPTFQPGIPIVLGNGEAWQFVPPTLGYYPVIQDDGRVLRRLTINYGPAWEARFEQALQAEIENQDILNHVWWFADYMLRQNYKEEITRYYNILLVFTSKDNEYVRRFLQIWDVVRGNDPKGHTSDGLNRPSERTISTPTA